MLSFSIPPTDPMPTAQQPENRHHHQNGLTNRSDGPTVAVVFIQPQCNMHCTFCITEDTFDPMTFEQAVDLFQHLKAIGVRSLVIGGGEPFDWPGDLIAVAREAKRIGFSTVQVGTNGIALPGGFEFIDAIDRYVLPIESLEPKPHNAMRLYGDRHHAIIMDRLDSLKRAQKSVTLSTVITEVNRNGITELAEFLRKYHAESQHVHAWHLYQFIPIGRGGAIHRDELHIPAAEYEEICRSVKMLDLPFRVYRRADMYHSRTVDFFWFEGGQIKRGSEQEPALPASTVQV